MHFTFEMVIDRGQTGSLKKPDLGDRFFLFLVGPLLPKRGSSQQLTRSIAGMGDQSNRIRYDS
jgi:hypothetical protein